MSRDMGFWSRVSTKRVWVEINRVDHAVYVTTKSASWLRVSDKRARALRAACALLEPDPISDPNADIYRLSREEFDAIVEGV